MVSRQEKIRFLTLRTFGNFFILLSLYGMVTTFGPALWQEGVYRYRQMQGVSFVVASEMPEPAVGVQVKPIEVPLYGGREATDKGPLAALVGGSKVEVLTPVSTDFSVVIPKIGANARIIPDVDTSDPTKYLEALQQGVAHAAGTGYPGVSSFNRNIYLFAHSTQFVWDIARYNAVFYLLKELDQGDEIDLFFEGKRFVYRVSEKKIIDPNNVSVLTTPSTEEQVILQTCFPPGTTVQRLLVIAKPVGEVSMAK